jgi:hypothetical protein
MENFFKLFFYLYFRNNFENVTYLLLVNCMPIVFALFFYSFMIYSYYFFRIHARNEMWGKGGGLQVVLRLVTVAS